MLSSLLSLLCTLFLSALVDSYTSSSSFDQDIPFRSTYADAEPVSKSFGVLPFPALKGRNTLLEMGGGGQSCFMALSGNKLYRSDRIASVERQDKTQLTSMYHAWEVFYDLTANSTTQTTAIALVKSMVDVSLFYVATQDDVVELSLGSECGSTIVSTRSILAKGKNDLFNTESIPAISSTPFSIVYESEIMGLVSISLIDGNVEMMTLTYGGEKSVQAITYVPAWKQLFVSTDEVFYTLTYVDNTSGKLSRSYHEWITGVLDSPPVDFSYDETRDMLWIAQEAGVHKLDSYGRYWRYGYHQGSPFIHNITSVSVSSRGNVWVGVADGGVARFKSNMNPSRDDTLDISIFGEPLRKPVSEKGDMTNLPTAAPNPWEWQYYRAGAYLPDTNVISITRAAPYEVDSGGEFVQIVTSTGISLMETSPWTLEEKSELFDTYQQRHVRPSTQLTSENSIVYGDVNSYSQGVGDNDGLWTSMHTMAQAYKYAVTGDESARDAAWQGFLGLEGLNKVTGAYPTFPARTYCKIQDQQPGCPEVIDESNPDWHDSKNSEYKGYMWKGDTSSDEIDGHLAAFPVVYDLVAQTDEDKERVITLLDGLTMGIVKNDMYLIDPTTNKPTLWGFWNPSEVNDNPEHYSERGTNSLGALAYLASAYSVTRNHVYKKAFQNLADGASYIQNVMNVKIDNPADDNSSDNELISLSFHTLFYAFVRIDGNKEPDFKREMKNMVSPMIPAARRMWQLTGGEFSPLWTGIYAGLIRLETAQSLIDRSVWHLRQWPLEFINWPHDHSGRKDIEIGPFAVRDNDDEPEIRQIRPQSERAMARPNNDVFELHSGSGTAEFEPSLYQLPLYIMKFYRLMI